MRRYLPLVCLALLHTIVDTSALLVSPLWDRITLECGLVGISLVAVMLAHSMPTSMAQGVFGFLRERRRMRGLLLVGPTLAAVFGVYAPAAARREVSSCQSTEPAPKHSCFPR